MGTHMIPRNTKGEGRILFIFSTKALIYTAICAGAGLPLYYIFKMMKMGTIGIIFVFFLALIGFSVGTFKVPNTNNWKVTRLAGGENIDDIILRYIKFKRKKNKIYVTKEEE